MHSQSFAISPAAWHPASSDGSRFVASGHTTINPPVLRSSSGRCIRCPARSISICCAIRDEALPRLAGAAVAGAVEPGQCFIEEGERAADFFTITAGHARLYKLLPDGRRQITGFVTTGHFLGLATRGTYGFSAEAIGRVKFCRFSRAQMRRLVDEFPALERRLLDFATNELAAAQEQMLLLGRKSARERLASFLVSRTVGTASGDGRPPGIDLPMSRGDIGDYLGLTLETVSRTFARLKAEGLIAVPAPNEIIVLNGRALEALATGQAGAV